MIQQSIIQITERKNSSLLEIFIHLDQKRVVICRIFIKKNGQKIVPGQKGRIAVKLQTDLNLTELKLNVISLTVTKKRVKDYRKAWSYQALLCNRFDVIF